MAASHNLRACNLLAVGMVLGSPAAAFADDAYVCDGGRLVYARPETIEFLKATDPCVAGYFPARPAASAASPRASGSKAADPAATGAPDRQPHAPRLQDPRYRQATYRPEASGVPLPSAPTRRPATEVPSSGPGADFRHVRLLNATQSDGSPAIYVHDR